ncbi:MAG: Spy/CpxP family protein refolding chaperone [Deltaproteobacteria bacterium]|nr:Spy/CpxP family protein refolding chaperone [Deltaproteobacteria bacterium]
MKKMIVAILGIALLATSGLALAQGWGRGPGMGSGPGGGMGFGPCAANLNLTAEQIKEMQTLRTQHLADTASLRETLFAKNAHLRSLWAQKDPKPEDVINSQKEVNELRTQLQTLATQHRLEARKILTPEQQTQLQSCLSDTGNFGPGSGKRGGGMGPGRGMGMGPGGCPRW